jgi:hypothetical protein
MNFNLPEKTTVDRLMPKTEFYEHVDMPTVVRRAFIDQVKAINWRNKLAATTLNVAQGASVTEIEVFEIELKGADLDEAILRRLDETMHYHILFVLTHAGRSQAWIGYKEATSGGDKAFKVVRYYHTDWIPREAVSFALEGHDLDAVYAGLVRTVRGGAGEDAAGWQAPGALAENVARDIRREKIEKQLAALRKKINREKQPRRAVALVHELRELKKQLEG